MDLQCDIFSESSSLHSMSDLNKEFKMFVLTHTHTDVRTTIQLQSTLRKYAFLCSFIEFNNFSKMVYYLRCLFTFVFSSLNLFAIL